MAIKVLLYSLHAVFFLRCNGRYIMCYEEEAMVPKYMKKNWRLDNICLVIIQMLYVFVCIIHTSFMVKKELYQSM